MSNLSSIRLINLRSLVDTEFIDLKPITVLVGKNSVGKSTFARTFPLFRQSSEEVKRAPILWYGRLVDFGGFSDALRKKTENNEIGFGFKFNLDSNRSAATFRESRRFGVPRLIDECETTLSIQLVQNPTHQGTIAKEVTFDLFENTCRIAFSPDNDGIDISVNDFSWSSRSLNQNLNCNIDQGRIIPKVWFTEIKEVDGRKISVRRDPMSSIGVLAVKNCVHGRTSIQKIMEMQWLLPLGFDKNMHNALRSIDAPQTWKDYLSSHSYTSTGFKNLKSRLIAAKILSIADLIADELDEYFQGVRYLKPLRANAERYYRYQDLAVNEIDSDGANLPMFLASLSPGRLSSFSDWTEKYLGGRVKVEHREGHLSLKFAADGEDATNVADMGFGISQVLPIAAQLWLASNKSGRSDRTREQASCIVIEQPELHLHPEYQAQLADFFSAVVNDRGENCPKLIIETHSPHIINRLGHIIAEGNLDPDLAKIVIFEQAESSIRTRVRSATFDESGILDNWPIGFFEPSYY